jgi:hypothetical protein
MICLELHPRKILVRASPLLKGEPNVKRKTHEIETGSGTDKALKKTDSWKEHYYL